MQLHLDRSAIGRNVVAVLAVLVVVVAAVAGLSWGSLITSSATVISTSLAPQSTSTQAFQSAESSITNMFVNVLSGSFQPPSSNATTINTNQTSFTASAGTTFTVDVDIEYDNCHGNSCPSEITSVWVSPASFTVRSITVNPPNSGAGLPALVSVTSGNKKVCNFVVAITAPLTPYSGPLTLTALTG